MVGTAWWEETLSLGGMGDSLEEEMERLRLENVRLHQELDQTSSEKIQSAQYGLVLLEEKEGLEARCQQLETLIENTKHDLQVTQEALAKFQSSQQVSVVIFRAGYFILSPAGLYEDWYRARGNSPL